MNTRRPRKAAASARRRAADARWLRHFEHVERLAVLGSWRIDLDTAVMEWTRQARSMFGLAVNDPDPGWDRFLVFYPFNDRMVLMQAIDRTIATGKPYEVETDIVTWTGDRRRIRNVGTTDPTDGREGCLIGVCQDITTRHEIERALERSALVDDLTGIANRAALDQFLTEQVERRSGDDAFAVALLDLDNFKQVNDTYGHQAGDDVLQRAAATLAAHAAQIGFAARLGGDEFVLAITAPDILADLRAFLARLLADLSLPVVGAAGTIMVRATIGVCLLDDGITTRREILRRADLSLYNAKALGKARAMVAGDLRPILPLASPPGTEQRDAKPPGN